MSCLVQRGVWEWTAPGPGDPQLLTDHESALSDGRRCHADSLTRVGQIPVDQTGYSGGRADTAVMASHLDYTHTTAAVLGAIAAAVTVAATKVPYVGLRTDDNVRWTNGPDVLVRGSTRYSCRPSIMVTSVRLESELRAGKWALWSLWPGRQVVPTATVRGPRSASEWEAVDRGETMEALERATHVALRHLGHRSELSGEGALVKAVDGPAGEVLHAGDIIVRASDQPIRTAADLRAAIDAADDIVALEVARLNPGRGNKLVETVQLSLRVANDANMSRHWESTGRLGAVVVTYRPIHDADITIDFAGLAAAGPSAGLGASLGAIDVLSNGELTGGHITACAGTVDVDGHVGEVVGIRCRARAGAKAGAAVFLCPVGAGREARIGAPELTAIEVASVAEALGYIAAYRHAGPRRPH